MSVRQYIGARYVPIFGRVGEDSIQWDNTKPYEPLTIVLYQGNSYTSRQYVPVGIDITNESFWALTGNYNAQVEAYRSEVQGFDGRISEAQETADTAIERAGAAQEKADQNANDIETINEPGWVTDERISIDTSLGFNNDNSVNAPYAVLKLSKKDYEIAIHNNTGNVSVNAASNVYKYMQAHPRDFDFAHNCDFFTNREATNNYPMRLNGTDFNSSSAFSYYAFAFDTQNQTHAIYNPGTLLSAIPTNYDTVFTISHPLIVNGIIQTVDETDYYAPRLAWGMDADNYYVIFCEGRNFGQRGMTLQEIAQIGFRMGISNLYTFDGGGSICVCEQSDISGNGLPVKINAGRDKTLKFPSMRDTPLIFGYKHV